MREIEKNNVQDLKKMILVNKFFNLFLEFMSLYFHLPQYFYPPIFFDEYKGIFLFSMLRILPAGSANINICAKAKFKKEQEWGDSNIKGKYFINGL